MEEYAIRDLKSTCRKHTILVKVPPQMAKAKIVIKTVFVCKLKN
jgi:hypothetical protein